MPVPLSHNILKLTFNTKVRSICFTKSTMDTSSLLKSLKTCIPNLDSHKHKGQAGRIGIVGGSLEYTGAPYFAGISALRVGADLVHVFCASSAGTVIKTYSPELIVHPLLNHSNAIQEISPWLDRLHTIVIGPGLGRECETLKVVSQLIEIIRDRQIPLIIDADGLFLITEQPELIKQFTSPVILTPNKIEFERLSQKMNLESEIASLGKSVIILKKGSADELITVNPDLHWKLSLGGSGRRCGGQGDLLSGSLATFFNWAFRNINNFEAESNKSIDKCLVAASVSCFAACSLVRLCNEKAFKCKGRSMLASDMIEYIHEAFEELFDQK